MIPAPVLHRIAAIARELSDYGAQSLAATVASSTSPGSLRARAESLSTLPQRKAARALADAWEGAPSLRAAALATAVLAAQAAADAERHAETVELVWTGPKTEYVAVSRNDEALNALIAGARETLLIVSYATYQVPELVAKMDDAVERGVDVALVLEFQGNDPDQPSTWDPIRGFGAALPDGVQIYHWPIDLRPVNDKGKVGYLHVKCAVADAHRAFISSANLTVYAMEMNMELGVVVTGGDVPERIDRHFRALIADGILQRWSGHG